MRRSPPMSSTTKIGWAALVGAALMGSAALSGYAEEARFEHVMNIGAEGSGPGQFKYVEDFAFSKDGHLLVTDAANSNIQVFNKTTGGKKPSANTVRSRGRTSSPSLWIFMMGSSIWPRPAITG